MLLKKRQITAGAGSGSSAPTEPISLSAVAPNAYQKSAPMFTDCTLSTSSISLNYVLCKSTKLVQSLIFIAHQHSEAVAVRYVRNDFDRSTMIEAMCHAATETQEKSTATQPNWLYLRKTLLKFTKT